ncbi:hypothetical protein Anas_02604, partial [Armadillidium nasatum]
CLQIESVRPQLQVLNTSSIRFLIRNLTRVVHEVSSQSHLAETLTTIRSQVDGTSGQNGGLPSTSDPATRQQVIDLRQRVTSIESQILSLGEFENRLNSLEVSSGNSSRGSSQMSSRALRDIRLLKSR